VAAAAAVASKASTRATLEAAKQFAEDRTTAAQPSATMAATERDALVARLALIEAEVEKLHDAAASANEAAERATVVTAAAEATTRDATQAATQEKATLETNVEDLERDLATTGVNLAMSKRQFFEVANQLHEEATRLQESNTKLSEDLDGESSRHFLSPFRFSFASCLF
jgi:hypothetical protein